MYIYIYIPSVSCQVTDLPKNVAVAVLPRLCDAIAECVQGSAKAWLGRVKIVAPPRCSPLFFCWVQILRATHSHFPMFCWVAICWGNPHLRCVCKQRPNLTSTSSKVDWSWSSGAQVLPKTSAVESRRPTAWKDGWFLFFFDLNTWMQNSSSHILAPSSQQAPKVNGPEYPWQLSWRFWKGSFTYNLVENQDFWSGLIMLSAKALANIWNEGLQETIQERCF